MTNREAKEYLTKCQKEFDEAVEGFGDCPYMPSRLPSLIRAAQNLKDASHEVAIRTR